MPNNNTITILIKNVFTQQHPIYKAVCINGFGSGDGNSIDEAVTDAMRNIVKMLRIYNELNISFDLIDAEEFKANTDPALYGHIVWRDDMFHEIKVTELLNHD